MNFKSFYLTENILENSKAFKDLKNRLSGFIQKEPSEIKTMETGSLLIFSPVGSWTTFVSYLKNDLTGYKFVDSKSDKDQLCFKNNALVFWARLIGSDAYIYITNKNNQEEPEWEDVSDSEEV